MSAFMSDRAPEDQRFVCLQLIVYDILRVEDGGKLSTPQMVDDFVEQILALDPMGPEPVKEEVKPVAEDLRKVLTNLERACRPFRLLGASLPESWKPHLPLKAQSRIPGSMPTVQQYRDLATCALDAGHALQRQSSLLPEARREEIAQYKRGDQVRARLHNGAVREGTITGVQTNYSGPNHSPYHIYSFRWSGSKRAQHLGASAILEPLALKNEEGRGE